jgi:prepilin-type N-terminal cleavage/methylation domain-containing protein
MNSRLPPTDDRSHAPPSPRSATASRRGVTLIELMVVMLIITIISSLTLSGLLVARSRSRQVKTFSTIRKLSEAILPYYEEYKTRRPQLDATAVARISASGTSSRRILADYKRIALRRLIALELPDRKSDIDDAFTQTCDPRLDKSSTPLTEIPPVARRYRNLISLSKNGAVTSSELLHMIVTRGVVADPDFVAHFRDDEIADRDGNGLKEFIDGWGNAIAFKRWPAGFQSPLQPITGSLTDIEPLISTTGHRLVPLIYSAGTDGSFDIMADAPASQPAWRYSQTVPEPYDPFGTNLRAVSGSGKQPLKGEVFLVPVTTAKTFAAQTYGTDELADGAFQTVGSPRDTGSSTGGEPDGELQSLDNIHNHDLRL